MNDAKNDSLLSGKIKGLIADIVSCDKDYEVAIETAFGGAMQNVVTGTRDDARELIEYLKRTRAGQVTFLPIDAMRPRYENEQIKAAAHDRGAIGFAIDLVKFDKQFESVIHNLLGNTLIVDNIQNATQISRRYPRAFKIVTLDGDQIAVSGSMTGGSKREVAGNLLANERRVKELEEGVEAKKGFLLRAEGKRTEYENSRNTAADELTLLRNKLQDARLELATVTEKQTLLMQSVTAAESEYSAYNQSVEELKLRLSGLDTEYTDVTQGESNLSQQTNQASSAMDNMSEEFNKMREERMEKLDKLNGLRVKAPSNPRLKQSPASKAKSRDCIRRLKRLTRLSPKSKRRSKR